jgi:hypothetical protein
MEPLQSKPKIFLLYNPEGKFIGTISQNRINYINEIGWINKSVEWVAINIKGVLKKYPEGFLSNLRKAGYYTKPGYINNIVLRED